MNAPFVQFAYLVRDVRTAAVGWAERFGAGPFFLIEHIPLVDVRLYGRAGSLDHTSAYGWHGAVMIELVQQNGRAASVFTGRAPGRGRLARMGRHAPGSLAPDSVRGPHANLSETGGVQSLPSTDTLRRPD